MANENTWSFQQHSGDKKLLTLAGWSAPHGRPYKGAVAKDGLNIRHKSTRYPGSNEPPTRHILGINYPDIELRGRFRDRELGPSGAKAKVSEVKDFIKDFQTCDISWGDIIHITGMIEQFIPGRESEGEVDWSMKILVDRDNIEPLVQVQQVKFGVTEKIATLDTLKFLNGKILKQPGFTGIRVNVLDILDDLVTSVTSAFGILVSISNQISNLESGLANVAKRLIAGVNAARTALLNLMDTLSSAHQDQFFIRDSAQDTINYNNLSSALQTEADIAFALLSDIENISLINLRGESKKTIRSHDGDTWESISIRHYGGPSFAQEIRDANGIKYGAKPRAGQPVTLPKR